MIVELDLKTAECMQANGLRLHLLAFQKHINLKKKQRLLMSLLVSVLLNIILRENLKTPNKDISRTVKNEEYFEPSQDGYNKFIEVLKGFILYDQKCGYVQGMNFIIAALVYHSSSVVAFWLFTALIENYQLRMNYIHGFEGYHTRSQEIAELMKVNDLRMFSFLEQHNVDISMITLEPIMSLFCSIIPLNCTGLHLGRFLADGWKYFHSLFLQFVAEISQEIYKCTDHFEILSVFKKYYYRNIDSNPSKSRRQNEIVNTLNRDSVSPTMALDWCKIIQNAEIK